jgi:hypothetical protein
LNESSTPRDRANRRNAIRSTGPKTTTGKARSSKNAITHGLSMGKPRTESGELVEQLANEIAGPNPDLARLLYARRIAAAAFQSQYVRAAQQQIIREHSARTPDPRTVEMAAVPRSPETINLERSRFLRLLRLDRYDQRALSRLKRAIRDLDDLDNGGMAPRS